MCNESCPENCHGPCDLKTGNCAFGCLNGWTGDNCAQGKDQFTLLDLVIPRHLDDEQFILK